MTFRENVKLFYRIFTNKALFKIFVRGLYNILKIKIIEIFTGKKVQQIAQQTEVKSDQKATETIEQILEKFANKSCPKCYGRGYVGIFKSLTTKEDIGKYIPCKCFVKNHNEYINQQREIERNKLKN